MPTYPIQLKRNGTAAATPSSLLHGEVALNYADGKLFWKDSSNVIQSFTFQSYALASHTHAASDVTSGTFDAARLPLATTGAAGAVIVGTGLGVSSGTVSVTYGTSAGTACQGNDSRLSDARTPTSHSHGNITNAGAIGSTANLPVITTTSGVLTTGSFGTTATTFCEGNDSRLSDTRTPTDGSVTTAKIANDAVTYAKIQNVSATDRLLGRSSVGAGDVEEITCTAFGRSLIDDADAATARSTLSVQPTASPAFTGAATFANTGDVVPLTVTNTGTVNSFVVNDASGDTTPFVIDASGNVGIGVTPAASTTSNIQSSGDITLYGGSRGFLGNLYFQSGWKYAGTGYGWGWIDSGSGNISFQNTTASGNASDSASTLAASLVINASRQLLVTTGSASACGVAFGGDPDTGLFSPSADVLAWATAGNERFRVASNGDAQVGGVNVVGLRYFDVRNTDATLNSGAIMRLITRNAANTTDTSVDLLRYNSGLFAITNNDSGPIAINTGGSERVRVENDGVVKMNDVYEDTVGATNRDLFIDSVGKLGYVSSIRASKTNIAAIDDVSWLRDLTPVSFHYRRRNEDGTYSDEPDGTLDYGLIAEDVEPVAPEMCFYDMVDGEPQLRGVHYSKLITPMLRYIQQLEQRIAALEERLNHA